MNRSLRFQQELADLVCGEIHKSDGQVFQDALINSDFAKDYFV